MKLKIENQKLTGKLHTRIHGLTADKTTSANLNSNVIDVVDINNEREIQQLRRKIKRRIGVATRKVSEE